MEKGIMQEITGRKRGLRALPFVEAAAALALHACVYESPGIPIPGRDSFVQDKAADTRTKDLSPDKRADSRGTDMQRMDETEARLPDAKKPDTGQDAGKADSAQKDLSKDVKLPADLPKDLKGPADASSEFSPLCKGVSNASVSSGSFPKGTDTSLGGYLFNYLSYTVSTVTMDVKCGSDNSVVAPGQVFTVGVEKTIQVPKDGKKIRITVLNKNTFNATCTVYVESL